MAYSPLERADAFIRAGELSDALDALNEHLTHNPADDDVRRLRVQVVLRLDAPAYLRSGLDDLDALTSPTPQDAYTRSVLLEKLGDLPAALAAARAATQTPDTAAQSRATERLLGLLQKHGETEAALQLALENDWVQWVANMALELADAHTAIDYYTQALARVGKLKTVTAAAIAENIRGRVLLKRAAAYAQDGQPEKAEADYAAAAAIIPDDPMIPFNRGVLAHQAGDPNAAKVFFRQAHATANDTLRALMDKEVSQSVTLTAVWTEATHKAS